MYSEQENTKGNTVGFYLDGTTDLLWKARMSAAPPKNSTIEYEGVTYKVKDHHYEFMLPPALEIAIPPGGTSQNPYCTYGVAVSVTIVS